MADAELVELTRGPFTESRHRGHVAIATAEGGLVAALGAPEAVILPRSAAKMIQALPLVESGAADAFGLSSEELALACASHQAAEIHTRRVTAWLERLGLSDDDLRCGPEMPRDEAAKKALICSGGQPCQIHNNCSGKHTGFLTLSRHLGAGPEYIDPSHPVQQAVRAAFEEVTGAASPGFGIDGCSAPNFAARLADFALAMARFADAVASGATGARPSAMARLYRAMVAHPELVAGEGRACTRLMRAMGGRAAVKTGAEGVFAAIIPERRMGVAVKISDGATRGSEAVIAAVLIRLGMLDASDPVAKSLIDAPILNRRGLEVGVIRPAEPLARLSL
ncbi:asparaginase [Meinhardsimonia xiamenensis]|jgi:L-asparaginase II|uniref:Asparaginase n=1 Tax=Meinhardsimonia xiamenensis TaxID=990712 RepID=A0A1G8XTV7_9RHOB|nr:asparaginase [Meinhardsimonia xiamenensis]PRX37041.1 asparaginase [Meinhardsimonia xiamenensis]SDJ93943.1 asparaginase [Meinhardsimonia xiamenensis]